MACKLRRSAEGISTNGALEGLLLSVSALVCHELCRAGKMTITHIARKQRISKHALLILSRVVHFEVTLLALVVTEDNVALQTLQ